MPPSVREVAISARIIAITKLASLGPIISCLHPRASINREEAKTTANIASETLSSMRKGIA